jgi:membrane protein implicated in regulation of membrane protease activity
MTGEWLMQWWNLIFVVPFGLALLYLGVYAMSGFTFGDADADVAVDGPDVDADAEIAVDADADADGADFDAHHGHVPFHIAAMSWIGIGRVPLSLVLMVLLLTWGFFGFATSYYLEKNAIDRAFVPVIALCVAAIGSLGTTALASRAIARWLPTSETYALRRHELLGRTGEAIFQIDHQSGVVSLRDENNDLFQVACRVHGDRGPIAKGARVRLIAYNGREKAYYVTEHDPAKVAG